MDVVSLTPTNVNRKYSDDDVYIEETLVFTFDDSFRGLGVNSPTLNKK